MHVLCVNVCCVRLGKRLNAVINVFYSDTQATYVNPEQTAPSRAVWSGFTLFAEVKYILCKIIIQYYTLCR